MAAVPTLSSSQCSFDPDEWLEQTGIEPVPLNSPNALPTSTVECYYKRVGKPCPLHGALKSASVTDASEALLRHFIDGSPSFDHRFAFQTILGLELPGLDIREQTVDPVENTHIDLRHLICHGEFAVQGVSFNAGFRVARSIFADGIEASSADFEDDVIFSNSRIHGDVDLSTATIGRNLSFSGATINGDLDLSGADVQGKLDLTGVTVHGDLRVNNAKVGGNIELSRAEIDGELSISRSRVGGTIRAAEITVQKELEVNWSRIAERVLLSSATIHNLEFSHSQFGSSVVFHSNTNADISEEVVSQGAHDLPDKAIEISNDCEIISCRLEGVLSCSDAKIGGDLVFSSSIFEQRLTLTDLRICGDLSFGSAELGTYTLLKNGLVQGALYGYRANIDGLLGISDSTICGEANLKHIACDENIEIYDTTFRESVEFEHSTIAGYLRVGDSEFRATFSATSLSPTAGVYLSGITGWGDFDLEMISTELLSISNGSEFNSISLRSATVEATDVELNGLHVIEGLDLTDADIGHSLQLRNTKVGHLVLENARVGQKLDATRIEVSGRSADTEQSFHAEGVQVGSGALFTDSVVQGDLSLNEAEIGGHLDFDGSSISSTLNCAESTLGGNVSASNARMETFRLNDSLVAGNILLYDTRVNGEIPATGFHHQGNVFTISASFIESDVTLDDATLDGNLNITQGTLLRGSITAESSAIEGSLLITEAAISNISLDRSKVATDVDLNDVRLAADLSIDEAMIEERLQINDTRVRESLSACDLRVGSQSEIANSFVYEAATLDDVLFKWDLCIRDSSLSNLSLQRGTFRHDLEIRNVDGWRSPINLQDARIERGYFDCGSTGTKYDCRGATLGNVAIAQPTDGSVWEQLELEETRFDQFEFAGFTESLEEIGYHIGTERALWAEDSWLPTYLSEVRNRWRRQNGGPAELIDQHLQLETTYRQAKDNADTLGDNPSASKFYQHEKRYRRRRRFWEIWSQLPLGTNSAQTRQTEGGRLNNLAGRLRSTYELIKTVGRYVGNMLMAITSGHGERIVLVIGTAILSILLFAVSYAVLDSATTANQLVWQAPLPFVGDSLTAFIIEQWGDYLRTSFGSFASLVYWNSPTPDKPFVALLTQFERLVGGTYIALLVFTLTRSLHR